MQQLLREDFFYVLLARYAQWLRAAAQRRAGGSFVLPRGPCAAPQADLVAAMRKELMEVEEELNSHELQSTRRFLCLQTCQERNSRYFDASFCELQLR